ncbi:MAG: CHAT domain-containing protein, partial [Chloroflexi bacterium]
MLLEGELGEVPETLFEKQMQAAEEAQVEYEETQNELLLDDIIAPLQEILQNPLFKDTSPKFQWMVQIHAGISFFNRYHSRYHPDDFEDLRAAMRQLLQVLRHSVGDPDVMLLNCLNEVGLDLHDHYTYTGNLDSLEQAIETHRSVLGKTSLGHTRRPHYENSLGNALLARYKHIGNREDLQEAILCFEQAIDHTSKADSVTLSGYLSNLGNAFNSLFLHFGALEDLERAIENHREATRMNPKNVYAWTGLGGDQGLYYEHTGKLEALNESIEIFERVIESTDPDSPDLPDYLGNLGISLRNRYQHQIQLVDLQRAIRLCRQALKLISKHHTEQFAILKGSIKRKRAEWEPLTIEASTHHACLMELAQCLFASFRSGGRLADLQEAIRLQREAIALVPTHALHILAGYRSYLGFSLMGLYERIPNKALLNEAIEHFQYGLEHMSQETRWFAQCQNDLGAALRERYFATRNFIDLQQALVCFRKAVELQPEFAPFYSSLGIALRNSYAVTKNVQELEDAIDILRQSLDALKTWAADIPVSYANLGFAILDRYDLWRREEDLIEARGFFEKACQQALLVAPDRVLETAHTWGSKEAKLGNWTEAAQAYTYAVQATEHLYRIQLRQEEKEGYIEQKREIYAQAAYVLVRAGQLRKAATTLEQGRAKRLGDTLARDRAYLAHLQQGDPQVFQSYQDASNRLRWLEQSERHRRSLHPEKSSPQGQTSAVLYKQIDKARHDLEQAIEKIRQHDKGFLQELTYEDIIKAAQPVVPLAYLVPTPWEHLVLLIQHGNAEPEIIRGATIKDLEGPYKEYLMGLVLSSQQMLSSALKALFPQLSQNLIEPLGRRLTEIKASGVILIPVGPLSIFPLHAVPYRRGNQETALFEDFDVIYTPSIRVLTIAQQEARSRQEKLAHQGTNHHLLAVGNPLPATPSLGYARAEVEYIVHLLSERTTVEPFYEHEATLETIWQDLPQATIAHFACHGLFDAMTPLNAELQLANNTHLTLGKLLNAEPEQLAYLQMVVLSACQSAMADFTHLPDEVVGLPSGFLQAGVPSVVGTLWSVNDQSTALLMGRFYELILRGDSAAGLAPLPPAKALRYAQLWLRNLSSNDV